MTLATPSSASFLDDGLTLYAPAGGGLQTGLGKVAGVNRIIDTGSAVEPWNGVVALELSQLRRDGDQTYLVIIEGSKVSDFASDVQDLATFTPGAINPQDVFRLKNTYDDQVYRYLRLKWVVTGTDPEIQGLAFIRSISDLDQLSMGESLTIFSLLATNSHNANTNFRSWMTGHAFGGPNGDGKYPLSDGLGNTVLVACPAKWAADAAEASPFYYGAIGDGLSHKAREFYDTLEDLQAVYHFAVSLDQEMDYLGLQAAHDSGRRVVCDKHVFIIYNLDGDPQVPLRFVSGINNMDLGGSELWMFALRPKALSPSDFLNDNYDFAGSGSWENATHYGPGQLINATFGGGKATMIDTKTDGSGPFFQWGQEIDIPPGTYEMTLKVKASRGVSYDYGFSTPPWFEARFFDDAPGVGGDSVGVNITGGADVIFSEPVVQTLKRPVHVSSNRTSYLTFAGGGYANYEVTELSFAPFLMNCLLWVTRDGADEHYPLPSEIGNFVIYGPGWKDYPGLRGIYYTSFVNTDGNHSNLYRIKVAGATTGITLGTGAYLITFKDMDVVGNQYGVDFPYGAINAGENIRFIGGAIHSCAFGVSNAHGAGISFYGVSFDYFDTEGGVDDTGSAIINNNGRLDLYGCHIENRAVKDEAHRLIHNLRGSVNMYGGEILIAPPVGAGVAPIIKNELSVGSVRFIDTRLYNCADENGIMADGPGPVLGTWVSNGNPNNGTLISEGPFMDVLGGAGSFELQQVVGPGGPEYGHLMGTDYLHDGIGFDGGVWVQNADNNQYGQWHNSYFEAEIATDHVRTGDRSLRIRKLAALPGQACQAALLIPCNGEGRNMMARLYMHSPGPQTYSDGGVNVRFGDNRTADMIVSGDGKTVTKLTPLPGVSAYAIADTPITGRSHVEFTINAIGGQNGGIRFGLTDQTTLDYVGGWGSLAIASPYYAQNAVPTNEGAHISVNGYTSEMLADRVNWGIGDVIALEIDSYEQTVMWRRNRGAWSRKFSTQGYGPLRPVVALHSEGDSVTMNCGRSPYAYPPHFGYRRFEPRVYTESAYVGTAPLYRRQFWVRVTGRDKFDRPIFGRRDLYMGESTLNVDMTNPMPWQAFTPNSQYETITTDTAQGRGVGAPYWATHWAMIWDFGSLHPCAINVDDFISNSV